MNNNPITNVVVTITLYYPPISTLLPYSYTHLNIRWTQQSHLHRWWPLSLSPISTLLLHTSTYPFNNNHTFIAGVCARHGLLKLADIPALKLGPLKALSYSDFSRPTTPRDDYFDDDFEDSGSDASDSVRCVISLTHLSYSSQLLIAIPPFPLSLPPSLPSSSISSCYRTSLKWRIAYPTPTKTYHPPHHRIRTTPTPTT